MSKYQPAQERVDRVGHKVFNFINEDAKELFEAGTPEHPMIHAHALIEVAEGLLQVPIIDGVKIDEEVAKDALAKAEVFKAAMLQSANLASALQKVSTISVILGFVGASIELLKEMGDFITNEMNNTPEGATPPATPTSVDELLEGIKSLKGTNND